MFLILICVAGLPVSARYATPEGLNAGINPGDTVFDYEQNLNFTAFKNSLNPTLGFDMAYKGESSNPANPQTLDSHAILINPVSANGYLGYYYPYYSDGTWGTTRITIADATIGDIEIRPVNTDVTPPSIDTPLTTIPYDMDVQFKLKSTNFNSGNFTNPWYRYELSSQSRTWSSVINAAGNPVSLSNLLENPTFNNNTLAFSMQDQNVRDSELAGSFSMKFQTQLDATSDFPIKTLTFQVKKFVLAANLSPSSTQMGQDVTLRIYGKPYTHYTAVVDDTLMDGKPEFPATGSYDIYTSQYNVTVHPDSTGISSVTVHVPSVGGDLSSTYRTFYFTVYETNLPSQSVSTSLGVGGGTGTTTSVSLEKPDLSEDEFFCIGDKVMITLKPGSEVKTVYLFITGPNICPNGAKPSRPGICAADGDEATFDVFPVDPNGENVWPWETVGTALAPGTYRVFGMTTPTGYINRTFADGNANDYVDIDLNSPSINAKFPEEAPGFFAKGDYLVSIWTARGSPAVQGYYGKIRWYILGTNYRYTGITQFPLLKVDGSNPSPEELEALVKGGHDYPGYSGINLGRNYTNSLTEGGYYLIYQHPMQNNIFDFYPAQGSDYTGTFSKIFVNSSGNKQLDLTTMQTSDALSAMLDLLRNPDIDDSLLTDDFTIQAAVIDPDPVLNYEVGDDIEITGSTNLEESISYPFNQISHPADKLTLSVYSSEMYYAGKTQSTYKIFSTEGTINPLQFGTTRRSVSFDIPAETSGRMKPGEYVAVVTCEDIKYTTLVTFVLHEEGYRKKNGIAEPAVGPEFTAKNTASPVTRVTTPVPAAPLSTQSALTPVPATKSPGFSSVMVIGAVAGVILFFIHMRDT